MAIRDWIQMETESRESLSGKFLRVNEPEVAKNLDWIMHKLTLWKKRYMYITKTVEYHFVSFMINW